MLVGAFHSHDQRHRETHGLGCRYHAIGDGVALHDAAEDVDQNGLHIFVAQHDLEGFRYLLGGGAAAHVQKVGRLAAIELDGVHGRHGQPRAIDQAADVAVQADVGQVEFAGFYFGGVFFVQIAVGHDFGMAEQRIAVEIEFGIQRDDVALAVAVERVDLHQRSVGFHVAGVEFFAHVDELRLGVIGHAHATRQLFALGIGQAGSGVHKHLDDFFGVAVRDFFNVHPPFAGGNESHFLRAAVGYARQIVFFLDICAFFDVEAAHLLAFGAGLVGNQLHAQNFFGARFDFVNRFGHLDATALATSAGMDLGLDDPDRSAQFLRSLNRFLHGKRCDPARHGHAEFAQNIFALVFVDFHRRILRMDIKADAQDTPCSYAQRVEALGPQGRNQGLPGPVRTSENRVNRP